MSDVFWIKANPPVPLAIVLCPMGPDELFGEMCRIKDQRVETVVCLLEPKEAELLGLAEEPDIAAKIDLGFVSFPMQDHQIPKDPDAVRTLAAGLAQRLRQGERIGVHCRGSIGRATIIAACTLMHLGWEAWQALAAIHAARGCTVPDTQKQETWILRYKAKP